MSQQMTKEDFERDQQAKMSRVERMLREISDDYKSKQGQLAFAVSLLKTLCIIVITSSRSVEHLSIIYNMSSRLRQNRVCSYIKSLI